MTAPRHQQASDIVKGVPWCARVISRRLNMAASLPAGARPLAARAYVFMDAAGASCVAIACECRTLRNPDACALRRGGRTRAPRYCVATSARCLRHEYVCAARPPRNQTPTIRITPAPLARACTRRRPRHAQMIFITGDDTMQLKRNMMTLALISAGIGFATCANVAFAASAPASGAQDQTQPQPQDQTSTTTTDQNAAAKKKKEKKETKEYTKLQTVQVNGFISSIENSTALKRNADTIVEAVSAEQIGKLPGVSIADALGRLPGLAVQTVDGRPQVLSIHGLGPDFSTALVNGGQQVSTSNNRDVQFDQYPASWFDNVVVHLSPEADLIGQGLSGTVDMHTIRPLEKSGPEAAVNAKYIWNDMSQLA